MNVKKIEFTVPADCAGTRLDRCLSRLLPGSSRTYLQKLITAGLVGCDGEIVTLPRYPVRSEMRVAVDMPETDSDVPAPGKFDFDILFEDDSMLVINKPPGVVVHPAPGNPDGTVVNALLGRYPEMAATFSCVNSRPGIVHRLDKDTSGCLVIAKTPEAQFKLGTAFAERATSKTYLAVVRGVPAQNSGVLSTLIGRHPVNRQKMAVVERNGKSAVTKYRVVRTGSIDGVPVALLEVAIETGRTHQIRVHLSSIKLPVLGDEVYGGGSGIPGVERQMLHAWKLSVPHPHSGEMLKFTAPYPPDFEAVLRCLDDGGRS